MSMAAKAGKQSPAGLQGIEQVKRRYRAARAMRFFSISDDDQRRPPSLFHHARSHNANHAPMPSITVKYHAEFLCQRRIGGKLGLDLRHDARLFILPLSVQQVQLFSNLAAAYRVFASEQLNHVAS